jgi:hypothetical protein
MSRLAKPYTLLQLLCILLSWLLVLSFKDRTNEEERDNNFLNIFKLISIKHLLLFLGLFLFSILVHSWTVLIGVTAIFYFFVLFLYMLGSKKYGNEKYLYLLFGVTFIVITILGWLIIEVDLFTGLFQTRATIDVVAPDLARTYNFLKDNPFIGIMHYLKLISYDFDYLWVLGIIGFCSSFFVIKNKKALLVIHSMLFSNLIMLGFFIHYLSQRYLFHVYSFYFVYPAIGIYALYLLVLKFIKNEKYVRYKEIIFGVVIVLILSISIPFTFFGNMFTLKMHNNVYINDKMAEYAFYPYREACKYVQKNIRSGEEVICTMPRIAEFYIDRDVTDIRHVRLNINNFNVVDEFIEDTTNIYENSLQIHSSFLNFIQTHKAGWVITDTRVNVTIPAVTMNFMFNNMDLHILGSMPVGVIFVAHWDSNTISKEPQRFQYFCDKKITGNFPVGGMNNIDPNMTIKLTVIYSGVEMLNEALCTVGEEQDYLPPNLGFGKVDTANCYLRAMDFLKTGNVNFTYNINCEDPTSGFFIHDIEIAADDR